MKLNIDVRFGNVGDSWDLVEYAELTDSNGNIMPIFDKSLLEWLKNSLNTSTIIKFNNKEEFIKYIDHNNPKEIWKEDFSEKVPYIKLQNYDKEGVLGEYVEEVVFYSNYESIGEIYEIGMYVKIDK